MKGHIETRTAKDGTKRYRAGWRVGNSPAHGSWHDKRFKADADLNKAIHDIEEGQNWRTQRRKFTETSEQWIATKLPNLKPSTRNNYRLILDVHLIPYFGTGIISHISPEAIEKFITKLQAEGLKPKSIIEILRVLNQIFRYARRRRYILYNPLSDVEKPRVRKKEMDYLHVGEIHTFLEAVPRDWRTSEELQTNFIQRVTELPDALRSAVVEYYVKNKTVKAVAKELGINEGTVKSRLSSARQVLRYFPSRSGFHGDYVLFLTEILTGMREGEILGLQWPDIDWEAKKIRVRRELWCGNIDGRWQCVLQDVKTSHSVRDIDVGDELLQELRKFKLVSAKSAWNLVFCMSSGEFLQPQSVLRWHLRPALKRAGLRKMRFHDLRHTYAALLIAQKESPKYIQKQMGHASIKTTFDVYGHLMEDSNPVSALGLASTVIAKAAKS